MILVTGASGNIGKAVVRQLADRQAPFRVGSRRPGAFTPQQTAEEVPFDFLNASTFGPAVKGCSAAFLLRPPAIANTRQTLNAFIDAAREHGVAQIVFISVAGAGDNRIVPHHAVEQRLRSEKTGWTILRPGFFAQNLGDAYRTDIVRDNRIFLPAGSGRVAFVDVRDVAEVAVEALLAPQPHQGQTYTLTGPEALPFTEVARILTEELARPILYQAASIPGYALHLFRQKTPVGQILVQTILHAGLRAGQAETVDDTLARLLGRPPTSLRDYVRDHRELWS